MRSERDDYDDEPPHRESWCKCGNPDMPGSCPGWVNCPMCEQDEEEGE